MLLLKNNRGQMLILSVVFMAIMLLLSSALVTYSMIHVQNERQTVAATQALQLAEAGVNEAIYQMNQNPTYSGESNVALGPGTYTVSVASQDVNAKRITATGYIPNSTNPVVSKTIKVSASIDLSSASFEFGVQAGNGGLIMGNGSKIIGNVYSNGNVSGGGTITGDASIAAGTATSPDQQWTTQNGNFFFGNNNSQLDAAQSFIPSATNTINQINVYLKKIGSPSDLTIQIVNDNNGIPSQTVLAGGTLSASLVTTNYAFIAATFNSNPTLSAHQRYWIMLVAANTNSSNYYSWGTDTNNGYVNNSGMYSANWNAHSPTWTAIGGDFNFQAYMGGSATSLSGVTVNEDARATALSSCTIGRDAYYLSSNSCTVGRLSYPNTIAPAPQSFPISQAQITDWETTAQNGGIINGNYNVNGIATLGPVKINGDLTFSNGSTLYLTGPIWVHGNATINNNATVQVDPSLGNSGTVLIADEPEVGGAGTMTVANNTNIGGNANPNSYLMLISMSSSTNALNLGNNTSSSIFFAPNGTIVVSNNAGATELTGNMINLNNNAVITYTNGLQSSTFSDGPGGSWVYEPGSYVITK